jgi:hypothetical protein
MRFELNRLVFDTPQIIIHLWSPWRCSQLEHQLFAAVSAVRGGQVTESADERTLIIKDENMSKQAFIAIRRVLKGWQEEAEAGTERRVWRWLLEGDMDEAGYDHNGEPASLWCYLRVGLERGGFGEQEKGEDVDLDGFGVEITGRP